MNHDAQKKDWAGISEIQVYLFNEGTNFQSYKMLGAHRAEVGGKKGWRFAVWAPNAKSVKLAGDFNAWTGEGKELSMINSTGVWYGFFDDIKDGAIYKYAVEGADGKTVLKTDPYGFYSELRPNTASVAYDISGYKWKDAKWLEHRKKHAPYDEPMLIYEVHPGSWKMHEDGSFYTYEELADELIPYVKSMGYTHIELMPVTEYPFDGSWGYQVSGYFAATSRYGTPEGLKYFIDTAHNAGMAVIMDWVPAHFPRDAHGLAKFDGTCAYEYADPRMGEHKDWGTLVFDYTKSEVLSFLMSSAYFWVSEYHFDGLRVDAVSSMLYRDYSRRDGEWTPNKYGGNQNLEAIEFLQNLNMMMFREFGNILMIAEESTAWGLVTGSVKDGGLGFNYKWNMGWMNDTLRYMSMDPFFRKPNHNLLTFLMFYAYSENFILPLSHDEVVHGKKSLIDKMYGDYDEKFDSYRALIGYYLSLPGKKLMFMGGELGQFIEWRYDEGLEWHLLDIDKHAKLHQFFKDINKFYLDNKSFWEIEGSWDGFKWINDCDSDNSVLTYMRIGKKSSDYTIVAANFTPVTRKKYVVGVPSAGEYEVVFNTSAAKYGGPVKMVKRTYKAVKKQMMEMPYRIEIDLAGLSVIYLKKKKAVRKPKDETVKKADSATVKKVEDKTSAAEVKKAAKSASKGEKPVKKPVPAAKAAANAEKTDKAVKTTKGKVGAKAAPVKTEKAPAKKSRTKKA